MSIIVMKNKDKSLFQTQDNVVKDFLNSKKKNELSDNVNDSIFIEYNKMDAESKSGSGVIDEESVVVSDDFYVVDHIGYTSDCSSDDGLDSGETKSVILNIRKYFNNSVLSSKWNNTVGINKHIRFCSEDDSDYYDSTTQVNSTDYAIEENETGFQNSDNQKENPKLPENETLNNNNNNSVVRNNADEELNEFISETSVTESNISLEETENPNKKVDSVAKDTSSDDNCSDTDNSDVEFLCEYFTNENIDVTENNTSSRKDSSKSRRKRKCSSSSDESIQIKEAKTICIDLMSDTESEDEDEIDDSVDILNDEESPVNSDIDILDVASDTDTNGCQNTNSYVESSVSTVNNSELTKNKLRPLIIDGCNVAMGHGCGKFSARGLRLAVEHFLNRGHDKIFVILPIRYKYKFLSDEEVAVKNYLEEGGFMHYISSIKSNLTQKRCVQYDDWYIVQFAMNYDGAILTVDNYRDLYNEDKHPKYREVLENRILFYLWCNDRLILPKDSYVKEMLEILD